MTLDNINTKEDILDFMKQNIKYGWTDIYGNVHENNMENFRSLYRIGSIEETLKTKFGTCIEQVNLMNYLCTLAGIESKMYVTRIYEDENSKNLDDHVYMHCFLLVFENNKVYQIEHPNPEKVGIYEYNSEIEAIQKINEYYIKMANGVSRPVTEIKEIPNGLSIVEFNIYINNLDKKIKL